MRPNDGEYNEEEGIEHNKEDKRTGIFDQKNTGGIVVTTYRRK